MCEARECDRKVIGREQRWCARHHDVVAVARWSAGDGSGTTYSWAQATIDNRRSRVLARIARYGIECDPSTLVIEAA